MKEFERFFAGSGFLEEIKKLESEMKESDEVVFKGCETEQAIYSETRF